MKIYNHLLQKIYLTKPKLIKFVISLFLHVFFYEVFEETVHTSIELSKLVMKYTATTLWMSLPLNKSLIIPQGVEQKGQMYKKSSTWYWLKMKDETKMKLRWNKDET